MNTADTTEARAAVARLDGPALDEAARTYLLGTLDLDLPEEVDEAWHATFERDEERAETEQAMETLPDAERGQLLRLAMLRTLDDRPETAPLFLQSVEQAGRSMFVPEPITLTLAAVLLMREYYRKGRLRKARPRDHRARRTQDRRGTRGPLCCGWAAGRTAHEAWVLTTQLRAANR
jgi:hypothetical protein